jgi:hypothetical protein
MDEKTIGAEPIAATRPSKNFELVIWYTYQLIAVCCIQVPMSETNCPQKKSR